MTKKAIIKKTEETKAASKPAKVTKESKLVELLSGKTAYTTAEVMKKTGFSATSAGMYLSQSYLDRKEKPYKLIVETKGGKQVFRYEIKGKDKSKSKSKGGKK